MNVFRVMARARKLQMNDSVFARPPMSATKLEIVYDDFLA